MKIGIKLMVIVTAINLVGIGGLTVSSIIFASRQLVDVANENMDNITTSTVRQIQLYLEVPLDKIRAIAQIAGRLDEFPAEDRRSMLNFMLSSIAEANPEFVGVWAAYEPNAIDNMDAAHVNTLGTDASGRFISYFNIVNGRLILEPLVNYNTEDFYQVSLRTGREAIIEPYYYPIGGVNVIITSLTVPIMRNGRAIGVAGIDMRLDTIQHMVAEIKPFGNGIAGVFSGQGLIIAHPDPSRLGRRMQDTEADMVGAFLGTFVNAVTTGSVLAATFHSTGLNENVSLVVHPLVVGNSVNSWSTAILVPEATVMEPVYQMTLFLIILGVVMLSVITIIIFFVSRSITSPLKSMEAVFNIIGEGDFTPTLTAESNDEIGNISRSFNDTLEKIKKLVKSIKKEAKELSEIGANLSNNMHDTATAVNEITANIQSIKGRVLNESASVTQTNATMEQLTMHIEKLEHLIETQSDNVAKASAAVEEMVANSRSVTDTLIKNAANVKTLQESSEVGRTGLQEVATDIKEIARESEGLLEINSVMKNISSQTNLLSMNAAIEAAHAGEAGKGFAVVADEIRKLAVNSGEQSKTIGTVLKKIKESIDKITRSTDNVLNKFEAIDSSVKTVAQQEENIRSAMEEQGEGSKQILESIERVNEITSQVKSSSQEMLVGAQEVIKESHNLDKQTQEITSGMNEMSAGAEQINVAVNQVNDLTGKNREGISSLMKEVSRFKVE